MSKVTQALLGSRSPVRLDQSWKHWIPGKAFPRPWGVGGGTAWHFLFGQDLSGVMRGDFPWLLPVLRK